MRFGIRHCTCFFLLALATCADTPRQLISAQYKVDLIQKDRWPRNDAISFNSEELVALGMAQINPAAPGAVERPQLTLGRNGATARAVINFDRLRQNSSRTNSTGEWLYSRFLTGERPVTVTVEVSSRAGTMTIHPTSVTISGVTLSGGGLEFLLNTFLLPRYPDAVIDRPFPLRSNIDRIQVSAENALVIRKQK
jgi:hypothetical protein